MRRLVIAIDGPAGSGKSTTARLVAKRLGYKHLDTGAMYRAVALRCSEEGVSPEDESGAGRLAEESEIDFTRRGEESRVILDGRDVTEKLREPEVSDGSSKVAVHPRVRNALVAKQREIGSGGGVVAEGRDTTTVVFPDADLKIYMDADLAVRAQRRKLEISGSEPGRGIESVQEELRARDRRDAGRAVSPLSVAPGAVLIDTSSMTVEEQVEEVIAKALEILEGGARP